VRSTKTSSHWARGNAGEQNCHVWEGRSHAFPPKTPGGGEEGKERGWNVGEVWTGAHYIEFQATPMYGCLVFITAYIRIRQSLVRLVSVYAFLQFSIKYRISYLSANE